MGIVDLFTKRRRDEVVGSKILVAYLDAKFAETARQDFNSYKQVYPASSAVFLNTTRELLSALDKGYDVVHLLADVSPHGEILDTSGSQCSGLCLYRNAASVA